jgi:hypothetical protein
MREKMWGEREIERERDERRKNEKKSSYLGSKMEAI